MLLGGAATEHRGKFEMPMFFVECGAGVFAMKAMTKRAATAYARRTFGTMNQPFVTREASQNSLADHLRAGAVFFEEDGSIMAIERAFDLAGLKMRS